VTHIIHNLNGVLETTPSPKQQQQQQQQQSQKQQQQKTESYTEPSYPKVNTELFDPLQTKDQTVSSSTDTGNP